MQRDREIRRAKPRPLKTRTLSRQTGSLRSRLKEISSTLIEDSPVKMGSLIKGSERPRRAIKTRKRVRQRSQKSKWRRR